MILVLDCGHSRLAWGLAGEHGWAAQGTVANPDIGTLALRNWPTLPAAEAALRSPCFRLQSAGVAAFRKLGAALPAGVTLPSFLRSIPPQEDTY